MAVQNVDSNFVTHDSWLKSMRRCIPACLIRPVRPFTTSARVLYSVKPVPTEDEVEEEAEVEHHPTVQWTSSLPSLPSPDDWPKIYHVTPKSKYNCVVSNPNTARLLAANFLRDGSSHREHAFNEPLLHKWNSRSSPRKVIIEAYPGPGALTRALLDHPSSVVARVIALEKNPRYLKSLHELAEADSRLTVVPEEGYDWATYTKIQDLGLLDDIEVMPWDALHPKLQFIAHIPMKPLGEQLVSQFLRLIPVRGWLFKYGRVPMSLLMGESLWKRIDAPLDHFARCKLTVISEAVSSRVNSLPFEYIQPYEDHFFPLPTTRDAILAGKVNPMNKWDDKNKRKRIGHPFVASTFLPLKEQIIHPQMLDVWDYVVRMLYILKSQPLERSIQQLGPGADNLLKALEGLDAASPAKHLNVQDFAKIVAAFDDWPFAPSVYLSSGSFQDDFLSRREKDLTSF